MKLPFTKQNYDYSLTASILCQSAIEVSAAWTSAMWIIIRTLGSMFALVVLIAGIVISTEWFIDSYGAIEFVFTLVITSFVVAVFSKMPKQTL